MKLNWYFQRGGQVLEKIPSMGATWIFSGTTQSYRMHPGKQSGEKFFKVREISGNQFILSQGY